MATIKEIKPVLAMLATAHPRYTLKPETVRVYAAGLKDLPAEALQMGASGIVATSKWFPALSELRDAALEFTDQQAIQGAADRVLAEKLRISWRCCPVCQVGPMVHGVCPRCVDKIEAAEVKRLAEGMTG